MGGSFWCPYFKEITLDRLLSARENNLFVVVWTVNEPKNIETMFDFGVDTVVTDDPHRVISAPKSKVKHWQD